MLLSAIRLKSVLFWCFVRFQFHVEKLKQVVDAKKRSWDPKANRKTTNLILHFGDMCWGMRWGASYFEICVSAVLYEQQNK